MLQTTKPNQTKPQYWVTQVERAQSEMGRRALCAPKDTARAAVRGELGWTSVQGQMMRAKCNYVEQIKRMGEGRWPRLVVEELEAGVFRSKWWEEVRRAQAELGLGGGVVGANWKAQVNEGFWRREERVWQEEVAARKSLVVYPKETLKGAGWSGQIFRERRVWTRLRMGVVWGQYETGVRRNCAWCGRKPEAWAEHVLGGCEVFNREAGGVVEGVDENERRERTKTILRDSREENVRRVVGRVELFLQKAAVGEVEREAEGDGESEEDEAQ